MYFLIRYDLITENEKQRHLEAIWVITNTQNIKVDFSHL